MELAQFVETLAQGIKAADAAQPIALNKRSGAEFRPGIGPHTESQTVTLALASSAARALPAMEREVPYPALPRSRCDVVVDGAEPWAIEMKMLRLMGDNGKPNDNMLMHILSPYAAHRSAVTDCKKLLDSGFSQRKAIVIFGYDYDAWPMGPAIDAFDALASLSVTLHRAPSASFDGLMHPVHHRGQVFGWEITPRAPALDVLARPR